MLKTLNDNTWPTHQPSSPCEFTHLTSKIRDFISRNAISGSNDHIRPRRGLHPLYN
jgi:hypothetical protein